MTADAPPDRIGELLHKLWLLDRALARWAEEIIVTGLRVAISLKEKADELQADIR